MARNRSMKISSSGATGAPLSDRRAGLREIVIDLVDIAPPAAQKDEPASKLPFDFGPQPRNACADHDGVTLFVSPPQGVRNPLRGKDFAGASRHHLQNHILVPRQRDGVAIDENGPTAWKQPDRPVWRGAVSSSRQRDQFARDFANMKRAREAGIRSGAQGRRAR